MQVFMSPYLPQLPQWAVPIYPMGACWNPDVEFEGVVHSSTSMGIFAPWESMSQGPDPSAENCWRTQIVLRWLRLFGQNLSVHK